MKSPVERIIKHFKEGDIVIFPTDTVYGIGCIISNENSIKKLYKIKNRLLNTPSLILCESLTQAEKYGVFDEETKNFVSKYWPGAVTVVVKAKTLVPPVLRSKNNSVAIRVPNFPTLLSIIGEVGKPIIAPSANFHGEESPTSFDQIDTKLLALVDYALKLEDLDKNQNIFKLPSTLVDMTKKPYKIIREGAFPKKILTKESPLFNN